MQSSGRVTHMVEKKGVLVTLGVSFTSFPLTGITSLTDRAARSYRKIHPFASRSSKFGTSITLTSGRVPLCYSARLKCSTATSNIPYVVRLFRLTVVPITCL